MAKFTPGIAVGAISGSIGGATFSHNRYGMYVRRRAIPTVATTEPAMNAKAILATASSAYQSLTAPEKLTWKTWASTNPVIDKLGQQQILTGHIAYIMLNSRLAKAGTAAITVPPLTVNPDGLLTASITVDVLAAATKIEFTPTPLGAADKLWLQAAVLDSPGINYVQNLLRNITISEAALATDYDFKADLEAVFGTVIEGQKVVVMASVFNGATGQLSTPSRLETIVVDTTV